MIAIARKNNKIEIISDTNRSELLVFSSRLICLSACLSFVQARKVRRRKFKLRQSSFSDKKNRVYGSQKEKQKEIEGEKETRKKSTHQSV